MHISYYRYFSSMFTNGIVHHRPFFLTLFSDHLLGWSPFFCASSGCSGSVGNRRFIIWPALVDVSWHASPRGQPRVLCVDTGRSSSFIWIAWESEGWYLNYLSRCFGLRWSVKKPSVQEPGVKVEGRGAAEKDEGAVGWDAGIIGGQVCRSGEPLLRISSST